MSLDKMDWEAIYNCMRDYGQRHALTDQHHYSILDKINTILTDGLELPHKNRLDQKTKEMILRLHGIIEAIQFPILAEYNSNYYDLLCSIKLRYEYILKRLGIGIE